jgi:hypothetical protein
METASFGDFILQFFKITEIDGRSAWDWSKLVGIQEVVIDHVIQQLPPII